MTSYAKSANASAPSTFFTATLAEADPEIAGSISNELGRQQH
jgi:glycine hydroxymethyltransferase